MQDISTADTAFDWLIANLGTAMESRCLENVVVYFRLFCICKLMLSYEINEW